MSIKRAQRSLSRRTGRRVIMVAVSAFGLLAVSALAADQSQGIALPAAKPAIEWTIGAVFILGSLVVAFKNSKRSHLH